MRKKQKYQL